jgi:hypothetical protein
MSDDDHQTVLLHQVHPVKLATDISSSLASTLLLWRRHARAGLLFRYVPPLVVSAALLRFADLDARRNRPSSQYVVAHMPPAAQAIRLAGDAMMAYGAWRRRPALVAGGVIVIALGWSDGLLHLPRRHNPQHPRP